MLFAVVVLLVGAAQGRVCTAHFRRTLTPQFVARLGAVLGYEPRDYVPPSSLLLYLNDAVETVLRTHFNASLHSIECAEPLARCSSQLGVVPDAGVAWHSERVYLEPTLEATARVPVSLTSTPTTTLRVLVHEGAYALDRTPDACHGAIERALDAGQLLRSFDRSLAHVENVAVTRARAIAERIAATPCVCFVEPVAAVRIVNVWSVPAAHNASVAQLSLAAAGACSTCAPLGALRGQGSIVSMSDTGVATDTCFFADSRTVPTVRGARLPNVPADTGHRKVRAKWAFQDDADADGHGTHVGGTLAGSARTRVDAATLDADDFDGGAPAARLVIVDLHRAGSGLVLPTPIDATLLAFVFAAGARVHSASWGAVENAYSDMTRRIDAYCEANPAFVFVAAAGNGGAAEGVLAPALGKNVLSVGASMVGADAFLAADGARLAHARDAYARDWITDFSASSSSRSPVPWLTPLIVAPGGRYVWSANAFARADGVCSPLNDMLVGLAGTSMAAPAVSEAVALVQQHFSAGNYNGRALAASGPLVICVLLAGTQPTRGRFPAHTFASMAADTTPTLAPYGRRRIEGHGRLSLVDSIVTPHMLVLANYEATTTLTRANQAHQFCVLLRAAPGTAVSLRIVLGYYDPVTAATTAPRIVNDLDVALVLDARTYHPNGLTTRDSRSNWERIAIERYVVDADGRVPLAIRVRAASLGFGSQRYALIVLASAALEYEALEYGDGPCALCAGGYSRECAVCGNGVVEHDEQCDSTSPCCVQCAIVSAAPCTRLVEGCSLGGRCVAGECQVASTQLTVPTIHIAECGAPPSAAPTFAPTPAPVVEASECSRSADQWAARPIVADDTLCCLAFATVFAERLAGRSALTPALDRVSGELVAAILNFRANVATSALDLLAIEAARHLVETHCDRRALAAASLAEAARLTDALRTYNERTLCAPLTAPRRCASDAEQVRANADYCAAAGTYAFESARCHCAATRHDSPDDCSALHCSAHGASVVGDNGVPRCECVDGWTGATCSSCVASPVPTTHLYVCVGLDRATSPGPSHAHVLVAADTVERRLTNSYYASNVDKAPDGLPGFGVLDCSCSTETRPPSAFATHADALAHALTEWQHRRTAYTLAEPAPRSDSTALVPVAPPPPVSSSATRLRGLFL